MPQATVAADERRHDDLATRRTGEARSGSQARSKSQQVDAGVAPPEGRLGTPEGRTVMPERPRAGRPTTTPT
eukprot:7386659-Prymnesium_polylepis.1